MSCFIIAEAGVNHNGSTEQALRLVEVAVDAGADAVKFQTFQAEQLVTAAAKTAAYQQANTGADSQFAMLKALEMSADMHYAVLQRCKELDIEFMSTAFDEKSTDFLISLGIKRIKIPSGEITNLPLLQHLAAKNLPLIMSTGMASLSEVAQAIQILQQTRDELGYQRPLAEMLTILHCTSNYPAQYADVNLKAMQTMANTFNLPVGYSDHTPGILVAPLAVAMGAVLIEKHFTLDKNLPGPDHKASLEPVELKQMVEHIRLAERCLGTGEKVPSDNELAVRDVARRSITLKRSLAAGTRLTMDDIHMLRPGTGIAPTEYQQVIGKMLKQDLSEGTTLTWSHLQA